MQRHVDQELADLKSQILRMGALVESQIEGSHQGLGRSRCGPGLSHH